MKQNGQFCFTATIICAYERGKREKMGEQCPEDLATIDQVVGLMSRTLRMRLGISITDAAEYIEVTPLELLAHERGLRSLPTSKLYHAGKLYGVKISAFFQPYYYTHAHLD